MNREIRFRGKRCKDGEWVYGSLLQVNKNEHYIVVYYEECYKRYKVDSSTVGQFTGLYDKNGKAIYEGDIVTDFISEGKPFGVIAWHNDGYLFIDVDFGKKQQYTKSLTPLGEMIRVEIGDHPLDVEVIGNIYDNPELLKGGEN